MLENVFILLIANFVEVIHVELADEGGEAVVPEVFGEDDFFYLLLVEDANAPLLCVPVDHLRVLFGLIAMRVTLRMLYSLPMKEAGLSSWFFIEGRTYSIIIGV